MYLKKVFMHSSPWVTAILLIGGDGLRFDDALPKQFHHLSGKKLYLHTLENFLNITNIQSIILVAPKLWHSSILNDLQAYANPMIQVVAGGDTRQTSSYKALLACDPQTTHVVIHDGVRPFVTKQIILENIHLATLYGACDTCTPSHDTIVHSIDSHSINAIPPRSHYLRGQTPQSFSYPLILKAHHLALAQGITNATDDCQLVLNMNHPIQIAQGSEKNIKITTELDLILAEQLLRLQNTLIPTTTKSELKDKIFAVTGATGGIGQEITKQLQAEGATVISISRSATYACDLTSEVSTKTLFEKLLIKYGPLDGLINACGYLKVNSLHELESEEINKLIHTNFTALVYACKYCSLKKGAHILNLASSSYTRGRPTYAIYSGMKAAVVNFTQGLSLEHPNLFINSIVPPRTNTSMRKTNFPKENPSLLLAPSIIAGEIIKVLHQQNLTGMTFEIKLK
ncbi:MAG: bifunctional cytidylyltransferase/SDR family oxidoreductase [Chlamydiota bacterium]